MCEAWPGPRCSPEMKSKLVSREAKKDETLTKYGEGSFEYIKALAFYDSAQKDYDATPKGLEELETLVLADPENDELLKRLNKAKNTRRSQINAVQEIRNGRQDAITDIHLNMQTFFSKDEMLSIVESTREDQERGNRTGSGIVTQLEYDRYVNSLEDNLKAIHRDSPNGIPEEAQLALVKLRSMELPDRVNFLSYKNLNKKIDESRKQLDSELVKVAAIQGVTPRIAASFYDAYREQYEMIYSTLPETERPDPPEKWIRGELNFCGYAKDFNSRFAPHDSASVYAMYRLRADSEAIPDYLKKSRVLASIDLETAGPHGGAGFQPQNGRIIEVGIVNYSRSGKELSRYSQLVRPEQKFLDQHGTGSEEVHNISVEDLKGQPSWEQVRPIALGMLENKLLLAQNASFERGWLKHHGGDETISSLPFVDTLDLSRKHLDLPNHKLETICGEMKVDYKDGHRALHDAEVTAQAYFNLQRHIKKAWRAKGARKSAPIIESVRTSRWG